MLSTSSPVNIIFKNNLYFVLTNCRTVLFSKLQTMAKTEKKKLTPAKKSSPKKKTKTVKKSGAPKTIGPKVKAESVKEKPVKKSAKKKGETLECFLTTACVNYYALPDDGYALNTLRTYRDTYLAASSGGKNLIREYYRVSPEIVSLVNKDTEKKTVYAFIYKKVLAACSEIERKNYALAKTIYVNLVKSLMQRYSVS